MAGVKPLLETIGALLPKGIKAWHASPHDFDKVDLSKIGTGQGAQSYGPGFYAAESPAVSGVGGEYWQEFARNFTRGGDVTGDAVELLQTVGGDRAAALANIENQIKNQRPGPYSERVGTRLREVRDLLASDKQVGPRVYELNLKADPRSFLQWDEPLTQQGPAVRGVVEKHQLGRDTGRTSIVHDESTGENIYRVLAHRLAGVEPGSAAASIGLGQREAMGALKEAGIPGVRYLDHHSRALGPANDPAAQKQLADVTNAMERLRSLGDNLKASELDQTRARLQRGLDTPRTYNYVVNNPDIIEIMRKLAIPGMVTGGAASVYQPQGQQ